MVLRRNRNVGTVFNVLQQEKEIVMLNIFTSSMWESGNTYLPFEHITFKLSDILNLETTILVMSIHIKLDKSLHRSRLTTAENFALERISLSQCWPGKVFVLWSLSKGKTKTESSQTNSERKESKQILQNNLYQ